MALRIPHLRIILPLAMMLAASACGSGNEGEIDVAIIGTPESVFDDSLRLSTGAQHVRAATESGLVAFNSQGEVVPALAERWLPTDDGLSFIFRLREGTWPDGNEITAASARDALMGAINGLDGTSLGTDLSVIEEVRAMAGRVIEIRLSSPEPYILNLLAQPELALRNSGGGTGPLVLERLEDSTHLYFKPPLDRGEPMEEDWEEDVREINLHVANAASAVDMFDTGEVSVVIGGDLGNLTLAETGPLSSGTLRVDSAFGLFGLQVNRATGLLSNAGVREALAMSIDRPDLLADYNIGGWTPSTRPVSPGLPGEPGLVAERWSGMDMEARREEAAARISAWRRQFDDSDLSGPARLTVLLDEGPGWDMLFANLSAQWQQVGIVLERADGRGSADLVLIDRIARYPSPRWFLNQFNCSLRQGMCSEAVDLLVASATAQSDPAQRATLLAQAEAEFTLENIYFPIASPLRWSLVRGSVDGFESNAGGFHPLPPLARIPR